MPPDPEPVLVAFGSALRDARKRRGLSQEELADIARLQRTYVNEVERGRRNPTLLTITRLAGAIGVPPASLLAGLSGPERTDATADSDLDLRVRDR